MQKRWFRRLRKPVRRVLRVFLKLLGWLLVTAVALAVVGAGWLAANGWLTYRETVAEKVCPPGWKRCAADRIISCWRICPPCIRIW